MHARRTVLGTTAALLMLSGISTAASAQAPDVELTDPTPVLAAPDSNVTSATVTGSGGSTTTLGSVGTSLGIG